MSTVSHVRDEQTTADETSKTTPTEVSQTDYQTLIERLDKLEASKKHAVGESKEYASKYRKLRDEVDGKEKVRLEEQENWKELLEIEKTRNFEVTQSMSDLRSKSLEKAYEIEVATHARDAKDVKDVSNILREFAADTITVDKENLKVTGVKEALERLREVKTYLFDTGGPETMVNSRPNSVPQEKTIGDMTPREQQTLLQDALTVRMSENRKG